MKEPRLYLTHTTFWEGLLFITSADALLSVVAIIYSEFWDLF